jgi:hypothetical protein
LGSLAWNSKPRTVVAAFFPTVIADFMFIDSCLGMLITA